ncbi:MAG TPA: hypothetical protein VJV23_04370 [Candidatus Polarisedimenticolia bacterium]|nr:hypothetical protein [Candidatus Polarisedimenticolia bacterium]
MSGLEGEFPGKVKARNVDATTPQAAQEVQALGFRNHGLVIRSKDGKTLWKQPDHEVEMESVRAALRDLLAGGGGSQG